MGILLRLFLYPVVLFVIGAALDGSALDTMGFFLWFVLFWELACMLRRNAEFEFGPNPPATDQIMIGVCYGVAFLVPAMLYRSDDPWMLHLPANAIGTVVALVLGVDV